ncbi:NTPase [Chloroflexota bacterium]
MKRVCLLTGRPGSGKTSLIRQAVAGLKVSAGGFYTEEIRSGGIREGFRLVTLDGQNTMLAHVNIDSQYRVSKYGVDISSLDRIGVSALRRAAEECDLVVIDEIGKMELFSAQFRDTVLWIVDSGKRVLGTIMSNPHPQADVIKRRPQVKLVTVTRENHDSVLNELGKWLEVN